MLLENKNAANARGVRMISGIAWRQRESGGTGV
jgi:hypothetical protein